MEDHRRRCTTVRQLELLIEFLDAHRDLALGRVRSKEARALAARLWGECAEILNVEGPARTGKEWAKVWNDQKCKVRAKLVSINASHQATGGGPSNAAALSPLEERVANILGREFGPLPNVRQDQFAPINDDSILEEIVLEEGIEEVEVDMPEAQNDSPTIILNTDEGDRPASTLAPSPVPAPTLSRGARTARERRRSGRASRQPRPYAPAQSNRTALQESRSMVLEIERMRAEAELKIAEARLTNANSLQTIAQSIERFSQSIDRFSQWFCQQPRNNNL